MILPEALDKFTLRVVETIKLACLDGLVIAGVAESYDNYCLL